MYLIAPPGAHKVIQIHRYKATAKTLSAPGKTAVALLFPFTTAFNTKHLLKVKLRELKAKLRGLKAKLRELKVKLRDLKAILRALQVELRDMKVILRDLQVILRDV
jgi:hypothetical protein